MIMLLMQNQHKQRFACLAMPNANHNETARADKGSPPAGIQL